MQFGQTFIFLPLALTSGEHGGCVAGVTQEGCWLRPAPVFTDMFIGDAPLFSYRFYTELQLDMSAQTARPEDRKLVGNPIRKEAVSADQLYGHLVAALDGDVASAFARGRSVGLIRVSTLDVYSRKHLRNRWFIRLRFTDQSDHSYDWIVPELDFVKTLSSFVADGKLQPEVRQKMIKALGDNVFLTIGLTLPNDRMPGQFRNCHPLVVGIHTFPDYRHGFFKSMASHG